jgi:hypothetical protein
MAGHKTSSSRGTRSGRSRGAKATKTITKGAPHVKMGHHARKTRAQRRR